MTSRSIVWSAAIAAGLFLTGCAQRSGDTALRPTPLVASQPVSVNENQDAAVWTHPTDPAKSLLLVTNEKKGLEVHDFDGLLMKHVAVGSEPKYVDVLYDVPLGNKGKTDLALATCTGEGSVGVKVWSIDPAKRKLADLTSAGVIKVLAEGEEPIGLCTYRSPKSGKCYFFVTKREGSVAQYAITLTDDGKITATPVRLFTLKSEVKSCIADEELGYVYVAEDDIGVWRYPAEPESTESPKLVIKVGENGLVPNVKGPAVYGAANGGGYLLVLSQGSKGADCCVKVYERSGDYRYIATIVPAAGKLGPVDHASGIAVTNEPTIRLFPKGVLAINDQINPNASEDFKLYSWEQIAKQGGLIVDTTWSRRKVSTGVR